ncbi:MAG: zinc-dependent alcohol dehydrogenase family protein, partial [Terriglobia bacterium]
MQACILRSPASIEANPLVFSETPAPVPQGDQVLVRVTACGVCRTDLHVIEGELPPRKSPIIPGHQVVGVIESLAEGATHLRRGARVGVPWLHRTCGVCEYCRSGQENLCDNPSFTGYTVDGGYAGYALAPEGFVYTIPEEFPDLEAAPLLCAGIIGFRALRLSAIGPGGRLGFYGFGAAAHVAIQVARHWGVEVYAATRDRRHQKLALEMGAVWVGGTLAEPPVKLDSAIIFAPAGAIIPAALKALKKGGTLTLAGIHMSPTPPLEYSLLYEERVIRSVANNTRRDGEDFLRIAADIPLH